MTKEQLQELGIFVDESPALNIKDWVGENYASGKHVIFYPRNDEMFMGVLFLDGRVRRRVGHDAVAMAEECQTQFGPLDSVQIFQSRQAAKKFFPNLIYG